jgi:hypothetical protein
VIESQTESDEMATKLILDEMEAIIDKQVKASHVMRSIRPA